jgi:isocitrate lyase
MDEARRFAQAIHAHYPGKLLAYNCSPSFHWKRNLTEKQISDFQGELGSMGYKYQFVTLAGFHALNLSMFELSREYSDSGMSAYVKLQEREFAQADSDGYTAIRHQRFVGTGYFDLVQNTVTGGSSSTEALAGSTESEQFSPAAA